MTERGVNDLIEARDSRVTSAHFRWPTDPDTTRRLQHLGENRDHWVRRLLVRLANWVRSL